MPYSDSPQAGRARDRSPAHKGPLRRRPSAALLALVLASVPLKPAGAANQGVGKAERARMAEAKERFDDGTRLYKEAKYEEALAAFRDASALFASPDFQYNIAQCHERLEEFQAAIRAYEAYLRNSENPDDRANVEARIESLKRRIELEEKLTAAPPPPPPAASPPPEATEEPAAQGRGLIIGGSILTAIGGLGALGGGIGFGVVAARHSQTIDDAQAGLLSPPKTLTELRNIEVDGKNAETAQVISIAVGGALLTAGAIMLGVGLKRRGPKSDSDEARELSWSPMLPRPGQSGLVGAVVGGRF